ncbi:hypothetical protein [Mammaliicoccus lentus]|uniref:hypothetical protein n=1 Tax=Mammaliicoccus lentus TaxID=42858 RepID=UPI002648C92A|nr:hypothetical protein [Mammaliicoccus lentus]
MKFKEGDRVHVTRICYENVDFYATLYKIWDERWSSEYFRIANCSNKTYEGFSICKPSTGRYGLNEPDYYVLAEDEEDTEAPVIQRVADIKRYISDAEEYIESAFKEIEESKYNFNQSKVNNQKVELDNHYIIEVKKGIYVEEVGSNSHFKFTKDITDANVYEVKESIIRHAELLDGRILNLKRYIEVSK